MLADALFDDYFIACELCHRGIEIVARAPYERAGSRVAPSKPDDDIIVWQRPNKTRGMTGEKYRSYPKQQRLLTTASATALGAGNRGRASDGRSRPPG